MKTLSILLATACLFILGCTQPSASEMLKNDTGKKAVISAVLSNEQVSAELLDSLMLTQHAQIMNKMDAMMTGNPMMKSDMMGQMMSMFKTDTTMYKTMLGGMMDMCNADQSRCEMMKMAMQSRPNVMKSMQNMEDMHGTKMEDKK
jgi:hypothetical protein